MKRSVLIAFAAAAILSVPTAGLGWGGAGHRFVGEAAMRALPPSLPGFLHTSQAAIDVGEFSRERDRSKTAGKVHDVEREPLHFLDVGDDGRIFGGPLLAALPPTRLDYDTAMRAQGKDSWKAGTLPYSIIETYQQLAKDFAFWRVLTAAEANPAWAAHRAWFVADRRRREQQILIDIGDLSHYVGDGSQPLHLTLHYNGWGDFPNPNGYTAARTFHSDFEGALVRTTVTAAGVAGKMTPVKSLEGPIERQVADYLAVSAGRVIPLYELEKAGGLTPGDPRGKVFATQQVAAGASELRDLIAEAWTMSSSGSVGWKPIDVADVISGKTDPYNALYSVD